MQSVSNDWIAANNKNFLPLSDISLSYFVENTDITQYYSSTGSTSYGMWLYENSNDLYNKLATYKPFIILDYGNFILDGNYMPEDQVQTSKGWALSGAFSGTMYYMYIRFSQVISTTLKNITIKWGEAFGSAPSSTTIRWYNGSTQVGSLVYNLADNETTSKITLNATGFTEIRIGISCPKPNTAAFIEQILFGDEMVFGKKDIVKVVQKDIIDPNNLTLPTHTLSFELNNTDERFNPDNPSGIYSYLKEGQELILKYGLKINNSFEYILGGIYFLTSWSVPSNSITATFEAGSKLDFMDNTFTGGTTSAVEHSTILSNVISQGNVLSSWFSIDNNLLSNSGIAYLFNNKAKLNEMIQYICNANRIKLYIDRQGIIHIDTLFDGYLSSLTQEDYTIGQKISFKEGEYELIRPLKEVVMTFANSMESQEVHYSVLTGHDGVSQTLTNQLISTAANVLDVNRQVIRVLSNRKRISGSFRPDIRLDIWDKIYITNKYATNLSVLITELEITYNGAFSGTYKGIIEG